MRFIILPIWLRKLKSFYYAPIPQGNNKTQVSYGTYEEADIVARKLNKPDDE